VARSEAKAEGRRFYNPPGPCRSGHTSMRYTNCGACVDCMLNRAMDASLSIPTKVYVFSAGGYVKIGVAETIKSRLQVTQTHCPFLVELAYESEPMGRGHAREVETRCHKTLERHSAQGEWFKVDSVYAVSMVRAIVGDERPPPTQDTLFTEPAQAGFFTPEVSGGS
jgi:hypothetical protein